MWRKLLETDPRQRMSQRETKGCRDIVCVFRLSVWLFVCLSWTAFFLCLPRADAAHSQSTSLNALPADLINAPCAVPPTERAPSPSAISTQPTPPRVARVFMCVWGGGDGPEASQVSPCHAIAGSRTPALR